MSSLHTKRLALILLVGCCSCTGNSAVEHIEGVPAAVDSAQDIVSVDVAQDTAQDIAQDAAPDASVSDMMYSLDHGDMVDLGVPAEDMSPPPTPARCAGQAWVCQDPDVVEHQLQRLEGCAFGLTLTVMQPQARLDALALRGRGRVKLTALVLNREGLEGVTAQTAERLKNHAYVGFRWNDGDMTTPDWYPQGITGEQDAHPVTSAQHPRRLIVSWYDRSAAERGVRISVVALNARGVPQYRHLLLVEPVGIGDAVSFKPARTGSGASLHAGGIMWFGDKLYVADTTQGFRVFDLSQIIEVTHTDDLSRVGVVGARMDAHGYRYVVPQVARYQLERSSCPARFSFAGLDRSGSSPLLISGDYRADEPGGRLMRWPVDPATGWLKTDGDSGVVRAADAFVGAQTRMQGALSWGSTFYISASSQTSSSFGRLYRAKVGQTSHISAWVYGAEDLYHERSLGLIWTAAEHPGARDVVSIPRQAY